MFRNVRLPGAGWRELGWVVVLAAGAGLTGAQTPSRSGAEPGAAEKSPGKQAAGNIPGGGTGKGPDVKVTDNGDGTVTMANGIVSIVIVKKTSRLNDVTYTYNNSDKPQTSQLLQGKGQYYYGGFMPGNGLYAYSLATDPASNGGNYADVKLISESDSNGVMETHFSMLRGSPGYYSTAILTHRKQDAAFEVGAWGVVTRVAPAFNWISADARRNFFIGTRTKTGVRVPNSPHEITVNLDGTQAGEFADKFIYAQDHADQRAWGWSSVGKDGLNVGIWMMTNLEFSNGGPMKRDVGFTPTAS
jgi:rhamnogalacturonan endolyase